MKPNFVSSLADKEQRLSVSKSNPRTLTQAMAFPTEYESIRRAGRVPVRVINVLPESVNIKVGAHLAVLQPLDKEITVVPAQQRIRQVNTREPEQS